MICVMAMVHQVSHDVTDGHFSFHSRLTDVSTSSAVAPSRLTGIFFQQSFIAGRKFLLFASSIHVGHENGQVRHLRTETRYVGVLPDSQELGLFVGKALFQKPPGQLKFCLAFRMYWSAALCLHGCQTNACMDTGVHGSSHLLGVHEPKVVTHHDPIDPAQLGRILHTLFHILVGAEAEKLDFSLLLGPFNPASGLGVNLPDVTESVNEIEVDIIRFHPF